MALGGQAQDTFFKVVNQALSGARRPDSKE
jgi:hypothetical protein